MDRTQPHFTSRLTPPAPTLQQPNPRPTSSVYSRPVTYSDERAFIDGGEQSQMPAESWIPPAMQGATRSSSSMTSFGGLMRRFDSLPAALRPRERERERETNEEPKPAAPQNPQPDASSDDRSSECLCNECERRWRIFNRLFAVLSIVVVILLIMAICIALGVFKPPASRGGVPVSTSSSSTTSTTISQSIKTDHSSRPGTISATETTTKPTSKPTPSTAIAPPSPTPTPRPGPIPSSPTSTSKIVPTTTIHLTILPSIVPDPGVATTTITVIAEPSKEVELTTTIYSPVTTIRQSSRASDKPRVTESKRPLSELFPIPPPMRLL